jgi:hypothetical protein
MLTPSKTGFTLNWDQDGERFYETGVERAVIYPMNSDGTYEDGVAWNGLTSFEESPSGAEANPLYADDMKYLNLMSKEQYAFTIGAYTYPDAFAKCDGSAFLDETMAGTLGPALKIGQQKRQKFGFCVTTKRGNDIEQSDYGYIIHLIYNCNASPSSRSHATENESPEAIEFSWEVNTSEIRVSGGKSTCNLDIDVTKLTKGQRILLEATLFGSDGKPAKFLTPDEVVALLYNAPTEASVTLNPKALTVAVEATGTITATTVPADAEVTWTTDNASVATVADGVVTGVAGGTATITATITVDGETYTDTCGVNVTEG